ncbi:MAG: hypothetical protein PF481_04175 [Bacteroidales bacterium]|jgi:hypothetical protein|nr:hypothetical protein [Bacteroidales bacterium]
MIRMHPTNPVLLNYIFVDKLWQQVLPCAANGYDAWRWPPYYDFDNVYYDADPLKSFDNYYGNITSNEETALRCYDAWFYSRTVNGSPMVALYKNSSCPDQSSDGYSHGAVTKPANNHPHGYDWESKPGGNMRTFHDDNSLDNNHYCYNYYWGMYDCGYGDIDKYYYKIESLKSASLNEANNLTFEESVAQGLTIIEDIEFSINEKEHIKNKINKALQSEFSNYYNDWKNIWSEN